MVDLINKRVDVVTGNDNIVIVDNFQSIRGGRSLVTTGFTPEVIKAGHVIIKSATGEYKPMPLNTQGTAYSELPAEHRYVGILIATIPTNRPFAGIMVRGTVNYKAKTVAMDSILAAVRTALPLIIFTED